ncbi:hypothetical protein ACFL3S_00675 [Gemmatimonadota bacterium]
MAERHSETPPPGNPRGTEAAAEEEGGRTPTPVRVVMEPGDAEGIGVVQEERIIRVPPGGREWAVRVSGSSAGGVPPLRTIPLLELAFSNPDDPDQPVRRAVCHGESLTDLMDEDLIALLMAAGPASRSPAGAGDSPQPDGGPRGRRDRRK